MTRKPISVIVCLLAAALLAAACAPQKPVLYPNAKLNAAGKESAQVDIDECIRLATEYGAREDKGERIAKDTAKGAAVGAIGGAVAGAIFGSAGKSAVAGAAGGGAGAMASSMINSNEPDPLFRQYVEKCLRDKGYETIGWK